MALNYDPAPWAAPITCRARRASSGPSSCAIQAAPEEIISLAASTAAEGQSVIDIKVFVCERANPISDGLPVPQQVPPQPATHSQIREKTGHCSLAAPSRESRFVG
jgi:hypothetical protein